MSIWLPPGLAAPKEDTGPPPVGWTKFGWIWTSGYQAGADVHDVIQTAHIGNGAYPKTHVNPNGDEVQAGFISSVPGVFTTTFGNPPDTRVTGALAQAVGLQIEFQVDLPAGQYNMLGVFSSNTANTIVTCEYSINGAAYVQLFTNTAVAGAGTGIAVNGVQYNTSTYGPAGPPKVLLPNLASDGNIKVRWSTTSSYCHARSLRFEKVV